MTFLTIFTAPKPFTNPHINIIQRNAVMNWRALGPDVDVTLVGNDDGIAEVAAEYGCRHLPEVATNEYGTPLISDIFALARQHSDSPVLAYLNADILVLPDFIAAARSVAAQAEKFLVVGQRYDLDIITLMDFSAGWDERLRGMIQSEGCLHAPGGSDYFIFPRDAYTGMPKFAVGRPMWDNWMIYHARRSGWPLISGTPSITIAHESHDYSHLPGGKPPYRLPEGERNIKLAGGKRRAMYLRDCTHELVEGKIRPIRPTLPRIIRSIETFPVTRLNAYWLAEIIFAIFHPGRAFGEWRGRIAYKLRKQP